MYWIYHDTKVRFFTVHKLPRFGPVESLSRFVQLISFKNIALFDLSGVAIPENDAQGKA